ncbi:hypothetical protein ACFU99_07660 [Streptomyces sp. NPDC057654]|uniref:hypothetical protein n=1 Tax=Streptomyces sp. NPDC057654 TaxID=3346196 RepID=UPI00369CB178
MPTESTTWTSKVTGRAVAGPDLARTAYVLSTHGRSTDDAQAAAVDQSLYSFVENGTTYALPNGKRALQRLSYPNVPGAVETTALSCIQEVTASAGPYTLNIHAPGHLKVGEKGAATLDVTSVSGHRLPGAKINPGHHSTATAAAKVRVDTRRGP